VVSPRQRLRQRCVQAETFRFPWHHRAKECSIAAVLLQRCDQLLQKVQRQEAARQELHQGHLRFTAGHRAESVHFPLCHWQHPQRGADMLLTNQNRHQCGQLPQTQQLLLRNNSGSPQLGRETSISSLRLPQSQPVSRKHPADRMISIDLMKLSSALIARKK